MSAHQQPNDFQNDAQNELFKQQDKLEKMPWPAGEQGDKREDSDGVTGLKYATKGLKAIKEGVAQYGESPMKTRAGKGADAGVRGGLSLLQQVAAPWLGYVDKLTNGQVDKSLDGVSSGIVAPFEALFTGSTAPLDGYTDKALNGDYGWPIGGFAFMGDSLGGSIYDDLHPHEAYIGSKQQVKTDNYMVNHRHAKNLVADPAKRANFVKLYGEPALKNLLAKYSAEPSWEVKMYSEMYD